MVDLRDDSEMNEIAEAVSSTVSDLLRAATITQVKGILLRNRPILGHIISMLNDSTIKSYICALDVSHIPDAYSPMPSQYSMPLAIPRDQGGYELVMIPDDLQAFIEERSPNASLKTYIARTLTIFYPHEHATAFIDSTGLPRLDQEMMYAARSRIAILESRPNSGLVRFINQLDEIHRANDCFISRSSDIRHIAHTVGTPHYLLPYVEDLIKTHLGWGPREADEPKHCHLRLIWDRDRDLDHRPSP